MRTRYPLCPDSTHGGLRGRSLWSERVSTTHLGAQCLLTIIVRSTVHGYPRLSTTIDSDANFMIYRRFGHLRTRVLMYHQDVLRELEAKLDDLDCEDYKTEGVKRAMCWRRGDDEQDPSGRKELLQSVNEELKVYGEYYQIVFETSVLTGRQTTCFSERRRCTASTRRQNAIREVSLI